MERIVVAGAGLAGLRAAAELRLQGFAGDLTVVGSEAHGPYTRPPLSKELLAGSLTEDELPFRADEIDANWILGSSAVWLEPEDRRVVLSDDRKLPYDGLVVATGRRAREWPGRPCLQGLMYLRSLDDALALRAATEDIDKLVVVGGGFIGCEVAATMRIRGTDVTIVETAPQLLEPLGSAAADFVASEHRRHGVSVYLGSGVRSFGGDAHVESVELEDGTRLEADVVVVAIGSVPNSSWLSDSCELSDGAVVCDEGCGVRGFDDIVAAGDVAALPHPKTGTPVSIEHWTHAGDMARAAARNLLLPLGDREHFAEVPTFWSDQYDLKIKSAGWFADATDERIVEDENDAKGLVVEGRSGDELVGAVTINRPKAWMNYRRELARASAVT